MSKYISIYAVCKCGHTKKAHVIVGASPTKKRTMYASCGIGSYPISNRYSGKCKVCKCNGFELETNIERIERKIKNMQERIDMNNQDIEFGEAPDFKRISRSDNVCCRKWMKELKKELKDALQKDGE